MFCRGEVFDTQLILAEVIPLATAIQFISDQSERRHWKIIFIPMARCRYTRHEKARQA